MNRNIIMNLLIRVCGEETIALASGVRKFYLMQWASGDPASLTDSQRYMTIL
jgi:hypothetical protein